MGHSIVDQMLRGDAKYRPYDFNKKYGAKHPTDTELLDEFDEKLEQALVKIRKTGKPEHRELIALYELRAKELSILAACSSREHSREILARSIQTFDDLLEGKDGSKNHEQCLLLARELGKDANSHAAASAFFGFLAVGFLVLSVVLAVAVNPTFLIFLIEEIACVPASVYFGMSSLEASEAKEALTSFTETGKGFFSGEVERDEPEKEAEKGSWWSNLFGGRE